MHLMKTSHGRNCRAERKLTPILVDLLCFGGGLTTPPTLIGPPCRVATLMLGNHGGCQVNTLKIVADSGARVTQQADLDAVGSCANIDRILQH